MELKDLNFEEIAPEMELYIQVGTQDPISIPAISHFGYLRIGFNYKEKGMEFPLNIHTLFNMFVKYGFYINSANNASTDDLCDSGK